MKSVLLAVAALGDLVSASISHPAIKDGVVYRPPEPWILSPPIAAESKTSAEAALRFIYLDNQVRIAPDGTEQNYTAYRLRILKPEGLPAGNLTLNWQPDSGGMTIHYVRLIRNGQTTDVLASNRFIVLQREAQLEQSTLTGLNTATLQIPGLQIGDEIALAATVNKREAGFDGRVAGLSQFPVVGTTGTFRFRIIWPAGRALAWRTTPDLPHAAPSTSGGLTTLDITMRDPIGVIPTEGAPTRYNVRRLVEYSDFGSWQDVSRRLAPLFDKAEGLSAQSPIKVEAATIAARSADPTVRAQAALQLVEDRIRYVFVALNGGSYIPANADETWQRRFGDCKAKTVLLVALLRELGIDAEPALVDSRGGDGLDQRLPGPRVFDHVVVRAVVAGKIVWLDGTRLGDRHLDNLPLPYRWALPLTALGATLEKIPPQDDQFPSSTTIVDIDATAGVDHDAHVHIRNILRDDEAFVIRTQLAGMTAEDAERALKTYWHQQADYVTPDKVSWTYDERRHALSLDVFGDGNPGWKGDAHQGHSLTIPGAGFYPPDPLRRPKDQDQTAPWLVNFPRFRCWATTIHLPKPGRTFAWSLDAEKVDQQLGGVHFWRDTGMEDGVVRTVQSSHSYEPEAAAEEADIANRAIPSFNNNMSSVAETLPQDVTKGVSPYLPFSDAVDWIAAPAPCSAPIRYPVTVVTVVPVHH